MDSTGAISAGWRRRLLVALDHLRTTGEIKFPKHQFDRTGTPPLPLYVDRPSPDTTRKQASTRTVWHADLTWAAQLHDQGQLGSAEHKFLASINAWLPSRRGLVVPHRERSLDIFGDEKLLERRLKGPMFAPGRLTLDLLQTELVFPPVIRSGTGPGDWLIVENFTTYYSLKQRAAHTGFDGQIIWGSGNGVTTRLATLSFEPHRPPRLFYFGDIDAGGMRIARTGQKAAASFDLPDLTPARGLYALLLAGSPANPDEKARPPLSSLLDWTEAWLGGHLGARVSALIANRDRIVQEGVGTEVLLATQPEEWF